MIRVSVGLWLLAASTPAFAAADATGPRSPNWIAIAMFVCVVALTLVITVRSANRAKSAADFYTAGQGIKAWQNGLAIAGDFLSAAAFLGLSALVYSSGFDGLIYAIGFLAGWPIVLFLMSERLRNLGTYTFSDAASFRLDATPIRLVAALGSLTVVAFYLIAQMIGAGKVVEVLFGLPYPFAVMGVGVLMIVYVTVGGMVATTWVQIVKAGLLLVGGTCMALAVLARLDFDLGRLFAVAAQVHPRGTAILRPGGLFADPVSAVSLSLALMFGTAGLPHILMRFFTVQDSRTARTSVFIATSCIAYFCLIIPMLGFGAVVLLMKDPLYFHLNEIGSYDPIRDLVGGPNMAAVHLAGALGGPLLLGFISAVAFATILAVVAGLTLAGASAVSHDLYAHLYAKGTATERQEIFVSKIAAMAIGVVAMALALVFEKQNVAFMASLALSVAASCNFPVLAMVMFWPGTTTRGAVAGGFVGLAVAIVLTVTSKTVWVAAFHFASAPFPYDNPALFSMPLAFLTIWAVSRGDRSPGAIIDRAGFSAQFVQSEAGLSGKKVVAPTGHA